MKTTIKYFSGVQINGNLNGFDTYEEALADYKEMSDERAKENVDDFFCPTPANANARSLAFDYVAKVTTHFDEDGKEVNVDLEVLDTGEPDDCSYQQ